MRHSHPTSVSNKRRGVSLLLATTLLAPSGVATTLGAVALAGAASASAASVPSTNVSSTMSIADGSTIGVRSSFNLGLSWTVPAEAKAGDTTVITLNQYFVGSTLQNMPVLSTDGQQVGTISGSGHTYTVTYSSFVENHTAVNLSTRLGVFGVSGVWGASGTSHPVSATVGGVETSPGSVVMNIDAGGSWAAVSGIYDQYETPETDLFFKSNSRVVTAETAGKAVTATFRIDEGTQPYAQINCAEVADGYALPVGIYDTNTGAWTYETSTGDGSDSWKVKITDCTPTALTVQYTPPAGSEGKAVQLRTYDTSNRGVGFISLTPKAIAEQFTGPYYGHVDYAIAGASQGSFPAWGNYTFTDSQAAGTAFPTANPDTATTDFNTPVTVDVTANDTTAAVGVSIDRSSVKLVDGNGNLVTTLTTPEGTYVVGADGKVTYTPAEGFVGVATVQTYSVSDTNGGRARSTLSITVNPAPVVEEPGTDEGENCDRYFKQPGNAYGHANGSKANTGKGHYANGDGKGHYDRGGKNGNGYGYGHCRTDGRGHTGPADVTVK